MNKKKEVVLSHLKSYCVEKEIACAGQVEEVVKKSGIEVTGSFGLLLKLLRIPEINLILNAKMVESKSMFRDEVSTFLKARKEAQP